MSQVKELAKLVDKYYNKREERLAADRTAAGLKKEESELEAQLLQALQTDDINHASGKLCLVTRHPHTKPVAVDWGQIHQFIYDNKSIDLLQRRLTDAAVVGRWEEGVGIPGIDKWNYFKLSISKVVK